jgi:two-component system, chemotaxis family, CheB/CheR fusion protein
MQVLQIEAVPAYVEHLGREPPEGDALFRELLIGVTQFFRDESAFEALKTTILPSLLAAKQPDDAIRGWVAGCATGEEVYSIAIVLKEAMAELKVEASVTIFGTDIDGNAVAFARAARYRKMDGVSPERLERWFVREGEDYCPVATIREMCVFSQHSVIKDPPFSKLDLVSCRNVLIYMDNEFQHRVMQTFHYGLNPGGYLFLGPSESVSREIKLFTIIDKKHRILQRHDGVRATLPVVKTASSLRAVEPTRSPAIRAEDRIDQGARRVMDKYTPAYFVIDRHYEVLRFSGAETGRYLEPSPGTATLNLFGILTIINASAESKFSSDWTKRLDIPLLHRAPTSTAVAQRMNDKKHVSGQEGRHLPEPEPSKKDFAAPKFRQQIDRKDPCGDSVATSGQ